MELSGSTDSHDEAVQRIGVGCVRERQPFRVEDLVVYSVQASHQVEAILSVLKFLRKIPLLVKTAQSL